MTPLCWGREDSGNDLETEKGGLWKFPRDFTVSLVASVEAQLCNRCILDKVDERYTNKQQNGCVT